MTEDLLLLPSQSQKSKTFVKDVTLGNRVGGRTERYSKFRYKRCKNSEKVV
jgi:hypothetical protein